MVAALALLAAVPARADVYDDNPAAASRGPGDIVVLARGADGAIYERHLAGDTWTPWASIGGQTSSGPAAVAYGSAIHVFVVGMDFAVYENVLRDGVWTGWTSLGGGASSAPAAITRRSTDILDLAVRGTDNAIHHRWFQPGAGWSPWSSLGGVLTSAPALNSQDPGVLNVFSRTTDGQPEDPPARGPPEAARPEGGVLREARTAPHRSAQAVCAAAAPRPSGGLEGPRLCAHRVHPPGLEAGASEDRLAALRDVRLSGHLS